MLERRDHSELPAWGGGNFNELLRSKLRFTWGWSEVLSLAHIVQILNWVAFRALLYVPIMCMHRGARLKPNTAMFAGGRKGKDDRQQNTFAPLGGPDCWNWGKLWLNEYIWKGLVRWSRHAGTRDFYPAMAALVGQVQNILFLTADTVSPHLSLSPSNLGRQPCRVACLKLH